MSSDDYVKASVKVVRELLRDDGQGLDLKTTANMVRAVPRGERFRCSDVVFFVADVTKSVVGVLLLGVSGIGWALIAVAGGSQFRR